MSEYDYYETRWECVEPADGVGFRVVRQTWTGDYTVRTIHEIELCGRLEQVG